MIVCEIQIQTFHFRAITLKALVGNIGGYVGLLMGVSIAQIPYLFLHIRDYLNLSLKRWIKSNDTNN